MAMTGVHDGFLVALSIAIAVFTSFTALRLASRIRASTGWMRRVWTGAAGTALGSGIWSMHFVAMLAFSMPGVDTTYDITVTLLSLAIAIGFTLAGFAIMDWQTASAKRIGLAGLLTGVGVVAMHYTGMAAMRMPASVSYDQLWVAISVLIAIGAATAAIWLAARDRQLSHQVVAACIMGAAIAGMHYAGMMAATFRSGAVDLGRGTASLNQTYLAVLIAVITIAILMLALGAARLERVFRNIARREARATLRLKVADILRERSTDEALHEVAALLGRHFQVSRTGYGQLDPVADVFDYTVCWTDETVPPLLGRFPAAAFGVKIVSALNAGQTVAIDDLFVDALSDESLTQATARDVDTRAILVVPFVRGGQLRTIVYLNSRQPRRWQRDEIHFVEEIAERTRFVIERSEAQEALRELNATLEARVEERTRELRETQEALLQSQKMEAVGQLVSGLAHDFNNVLGAIVGAFELLQRRAEDPERVRHYAVAGIAAAERGSKLTGQLLAFSRSQRIQLEPLIVCDIIDGLRDMLARTLGPMIELEFDLNPSPVPVMADATQVEMMVLNLAINARDAMPDGGTLVIATALRTVAGDSEMEDGDYVELSVRDTGSGMDEATLRRAMEPFFTTKPLGKGTGLGLAQIYGSARQSGGSVRIDSALGRGTTVSVFLPRTDREPRRLIDGAAVHSGRSGPSLNVLIVDDDHDVRRLTAGALEALGHHVREATDGHAALIAIEEQLPDIAIIDFAMPGMNGAELAQKIGESWPDLPILFVSGFADTAAIEATAVRSTVLRKPFRIHQLLQAIDEVAATQVGVRPAAGHGPAITDIDDQHGSIAGGGHPSNG